MRLKSHEGLSVTVPQSELNQPRRYSRLSDLSESGRSSNSHRGWSTEDRMVPNVEYIHPGLELVTLFEVEPFDQREVPVLLVRRPKRIPANRAVAGGGRHSVRNRLSSTHEI